MSIAPILILWFPVVAPEGIAKVAAKVAEVTLPEYTFSPASLKSKSLFQSIQIIN